jgi:hypothetical protein
MISGSDHDRAIDPLLIEHLAKIQRFVDGVLDTSSTYTTGPSALEATDID